MPSRNRKKRSKQRAEYLQKQDDILSQENKAKARARYKADPEKKKASVRDSYNADIESKQSAKRQRYQEDVEENRAAKRQKYEDNSAAIKASERNRYWNDPAVRLAKRAAERKRYRMGHRTTTTTQSYSLYEPKSHALMEYNGGLEKAILRDSELLSEVNDAFLDLNGRCVVAEEIGDRDKDTMRPLKWKCTNECRKLTSEEVELVVRTKSLFQMSIEDLRAGLDGLDSGCSHVHTDITLKLHSGFIEQLGHPIYCELPECSSPLRVIRAAMPHFPVLRIFTRLLYKARKCHMTILAIDSALSCGNIDELIPFLGLKAKFSDLFSEDGVEHAVVSEDHLSSGLGCIERDLKVTHADLIAELQSKFNDDAEFACCSCERLCQRKQVSRVNFSLDKYKTDAWQRTKALVLQNGVTEQLLYICQYCRPFLNKNTIPARCVLNGLVTEPTPLELKSLNALCKQLIQRAKAFQIIVRLGTYLGKVPAYNALQACRGCMFFLPLPLNKTWDTLSEVELGLGGRNTSSDSSTVHPATAPATAARSSAAPQSSATSSSSSTVPTASSSRATATSSSSRAAPAATSRSSRAAPAATSTSPTTGTYTSAPTTTSPAAPLAAATTTHMHAPMATTRPLEKTRRSTRPNS
ncbi:hypothetical protein EMCRGX_G022512 [Ephydatia muelleri]